MNPVETHEASITFLISGIELLLLFLLFYFLFLMLLFLLL
jgi:hypothetical protein